MQNLWNSVESTFPQFFGAAVYTSWLKPLDYREFINGTIIVATPTAFMRDWVNNNCTTKIITLLQDMNPAILKLEIIVDSSLKKTFNNSNEIAYDISNTEGDTKRTNFATIGSRLDPKYTFDSFIVGQSNELAHAAAIRVAESKEVHFNPLFIYGGVGLGKTHLMHAIAWHIQEKHPKRKVVYLSAEKFMYLFIRALRFRDTVTFKEKFRAVDILMIDDFQFISGKESTQEEFFHTFNALVDQNHQVIISADKSPSDLPGLEERMRSRLGWGLVADVHPTTYELRLSILQSKVEQLNIKLVPKDVLEFLAHKIISNIRELEGALNRLIAHATLINRKISIDSAYYVLQDVLRANNKRITIDEIQRKVAEHYNIKISDMHSSKRVRNVVRPRQIAMFLAKELTEESLPSIGRKFGGKDHATIIHAIRKIKDLMQTDGNMAEDIQLLRRTFQ